MLNHPLATAADAYQAMEDIEGLTSTKDTSQSSYLPTSISPLSHDSTHQSSSTAIVQPNNGSVSPNTHPDIELGGVDKVYKADAVHET